MAAEGYDYIVVGAGAAGCIIAARLSEDERVRVLLIEAGGSDRGLLTRIPLLTFAASASVRRNWNFVTEPIAALDNRRQTWNQGRIVGGSGSINGMVYMRGHPREYDAWRDVAGEEWSFESLLEYFKRGESNTRGEGKWHGGSGPIKVRPSALDLPICEAFLQAAQACGYPFLGDLNGGASEGFGRYDCNIDRGVRSSSARAYLRPARHRRNLHVMSNALALRVPCERGRASGVEVAQSGTTITIRAEREVVLCGGAINTPALLMQSGIGPAEHLSKLGIFVAADVPEVGQNLRNHPAHFQQHHCSAPVTAYSYLSPLKGARACFDYLVHRRGPFAESFSATGGFMRSAPEVGLADSVVLMAPSLVRRAGGNEKWWSLLPAEHGFLLAVALGRAHSTGNIRLRSAEPRDRPLIFPNYFQDERDMRALIDAVRAARRILRQDCISRYIDLTRDGPDLTDDPAQIERSIRATSGSFSHPSGTCRMGTDARAVVDPQLRVNGIEGLRVADNSVIPIALSAAMHAPALMIGEKASALIAGEGERLQCH